MKLIQPISTKDLEEIQINAELDSVGLFDIDVNFEEALQKSSNHVMLLCAEIKRLRYTYGEEWWIPCSKSFQEIEEERKEYERHGKGRLFLRIPEGA